MAETAPGITDLLTPVDAAMRLGVSPELLFHYSSRDSRTKGGSFRLQSSSIDGRTLFSASAVDAFDERLGESRSDAEQPRAKIDPAVVAHLKVEAGGACARCASGISVESAHIVAYRETRSNHHRNLLRLCSACHKEFDLGSITVAEMITLKTKLTLKLCERMRVSSGIVVAELPARRGIVGRDDEVARITDALRISRLVVVRGVGGIGKTQTLLAALAVAETGRPVVWVSLEDCPSPAALRAYVDAASNRIAQGEFVETLSANRACVIFDGVEQAAGGAHTVSDLVDLLCSDGLDIQIVLTSQVALPELSPDVELTIHRLDPVWAASMLPVEEEASPATGRLLAFADGHPLSLRIIAALIRHFGDREEVARRLCDRTGTRLEMPGRTVQGRETSLDLCLAAAIEALAEPERSALWVIAQFPAGMATTFVSLESVGCEDPASLVANLRQWHLIDVGRLWGGSLLAMLAPVRHFVRRSLHEGTLPDLHYLRRRTALTVAARIEEADAELIHGGKIESGMILFDRELSNALAIMSLACDQASEDRGFRLIASMLAANLQTYFFSSGAFELGAEVMRRAADLALAAGEVRDALDTLAQLQSLALRARRFDLADLAHRQAVTLDCGGDFVAQAIVLGIEASIERSRPEGFLTDARVALDAADKAARSYETFLEAAGGRLTHRAALALLQQACLLEDGGRPDEALPLLERCSKYFLKMEDPINGGSSLQRLGNCLAYAGRIEEAMASYAESAALFHRLEAVDYRSNALGEAGLLMAEHRKLALHPAITPEIVLGGIDDIVDRAVAAMPEIKVPGNGWPHVLTRKLCGLIAMSSLNHDPACIRHLGDRLRNEVADRLLEREPAEWRAVGGGSLVSAHFSSLAWLCEEIADVKPHDRRATLSEVEGFAIVVEDMFRGGERDLMFSWLARYLSERRGLSGLSSGAIRAATDGLAYGDQFDLDGFDLR